jgi:hypothetical protein
MLGWETWIQYEKNSNHFDFYQNLPKVFFFCLLFSTSYNVYNYNNWIVLEFAFNNHIGIFYNFWEITQIYNTAKMRHICRLPWFLIKIQLLNNQCSISFAPTCQHHHLANFYIMNWRCCVDLWVSNKMCAIEFYTLRVDVDF